MKMSVEEFVYEVMTDLEDRLEGHLTDEEWDTIAHAVEGAIERLDGEEGADDGC